MDKDVSYSMSILLTRWMIRELYMLYLRGFEMKGR